MNPATARRMVLISLGAMFGVIAIRSAQGKEKGSTYRRLWATGALALLLSTTADFVPEIAGPLALLIGMTYLMGAESTIADWLHGGLNPAGASSSPGSTAGRVSGQASSSKGGVARQ